MGLSLSYDIVKAHGGELTVKTKEGDGSEFIITISAWYVRKIGCIYDHDLQHCFETNQIKCLYLAKGRIRHSKARVKAFSGYKTSIITILKRRGMIKAHVKDLGQETNWLIKLMIKKADGFQPKVLVSTKKEMAGLK